jgi:hypothetical protein
MSDTPVITHRYIFKNYDNQNDNLTVVDITAEHVMYKFDESRYVYAMTHETWIEGDYKDMTNA